MKKWDGVFSAMRLIYFFAFLGLIACMVVLEITKIELLGLQCEFTRVIQESKKIRYNNVDEYKILADARVVISALRPIEDFEILEQNGLKINSVTEWLGKDSVMFIYKKPVDTKKWKKYFKKYIQPKLEK